MNMRPYSTVKPQKAKAGDPYKVIPIPPRSVVRKARREVRSDGDIGRIFRIGYYGQIDGLDCIWLVSEDGDYEQTTDHEGLYRCYDVLMVSDERSLYGKNRPKIPPVRHAGKTPIRGAGR
jgi:hypothetical protein